MLCVSGLVRISMSIPTETFNVSLGNVELFNVCLDGESVVNVTVRDIDTKLQSDQDDAEVMVVGLSTTSTAVPPTAVQLGMATRCRFRRRWILVADKG